tara:strand:- start:4932 stop:5366 length:435 start_codon:yes stop_codon:yes gene_type:complete
MIYNYYYKNYISEIYKIESETFEYPWLKNQFSRYSMDFDNSMSYIYKLKDKVAGYLMAELILDEIHIHNIVVKKECRSKSIAKDMISHIISRAQKGSKNKICLEVSSSNMPALNLYSRLGFRKVGIRKKYYQDGMDAILMTLYI